MARVLNKIIELLSGHKQTLTKSQDPHPPPDLDISLMDGMGDEVDSKSASGELHTLKLADRIDKEGLTTSHRLEIEQYCNEKRVKYKLTELGFVLEEIDHSLTRFRKLKPTSKERAKLRLELLEGVKDAEFMLTEAREFSAELRVCERETKEAEARADFILQACRHICGQDGAQTELTGNTGV